MIPDHWGHIRRCDTEVMYYPMAFCQSDDVMWRLCDQSDYSEPHCEPISTSCCVKCWGNQFVVLVLVPVIKFGLCRTNGVWRKPISHKTTKHCLLAFVNDKSPAVFWKHSGEPFVFVRTTKRRTTPILSNPLWFDRVFWACRHRSYFLDVSPER